ncbi:MAG: hypothetical protein AAGD07_15955, partial [Planctomycetota bacterium]
MTKKEAESATDEKKAVPAEEIVLSVSKDDLDEHGFTSVWNVASSTCDGDLERTRDMAGRILGFLCKKDYEHVLVS